MKKVAFIMFFLLFSWTSIYGEQQSMLEEGEIRDTLKSKIPLWKKIEFGIGYSGGIFGDYLSRMEKILNDTPEGIESNDKNDDSIKVEKSSFWKKSKYTIGYSGGIWWTGYHLSRSEVGPSLDPTVSFCWLNSIEESIIYSLNDKVKKIEAGIGYVWWPRLKNRVGLYLYLPNKDPKTGYAYVVTSDWTLSGNEIFLKANIRNFFIGLSLYFVKAFTRESLFSYTSNVYLSDTTADVNRWCIGYGIFYVWEEKEDKSIISPYIKLQIGSAKEFKNNAPWKWKEKLSFRLTGAFVGVKFKVGGKK